MKNFGFDHKEYLPLVFLENYFSSPFVVTLNSFPINTFLRISGSVTSDFLKKANFFLPLYL